MTYILKMETASLGFKLRLKNLHSTLSTIIQRMYRFKKMFQQLLSE